MRRKNGVTDRQNDRTTDNAITVCLVAPPTEAYKWNRIMYREAPTGSHVREPPSAAYNYYRVSLSGDFLIIIIIIIIHFTTINRVIVEGQHIIL